MNISWQPDRLMFRGARLISNVWAASWISFGLASGISQGLTSVRVAFDLTASGIFFALLQWLTQKRTELGGVLLFLFGLTLAVCLPIFSNHPHGSGFTFVALTLSLPPLVAGLMVMADCHSKKLRSIPRQEQFSPLTSRKSCQGQVGEI
ncbi:MAG: hypothetical protein U0V70_05355 [Terriglobia bacterium]